MPLQADALRSFHRHLLQSCNAGAHRIVPGRVNATTSRDALSLTCTDRRYAVPQRTQDTLAMTEISR